MIRSFFFLVSNDPSGPGGSFDIKKKKKIGQYYVFFRMPNVRFWKKHVFKRLEYEKTLCLSSQTFWNPTKKQMFICHLGSHFFLYWKIVRVFFPISPLSVFGLWSIARWINNNSLFVVAIFVVSKVNATFRSCILSLISIGDDGTACIGKTLKDFTPISVLYSTLWATPS